MADRFTTMRFGRYIFEYDFDTGKLRLSWTGEQTFLDPDETKALRDFLVEVLSTRAPSQPAKLARPPYSIGSHADAQNWRLWVEQASDDEVLEALHGSGDSWDTLPAQECRDGLKNRGYVLLGARPSEVTLQRPARTDTIENITTSVDDRTVTKG